MVARLVIAAPSSGSGKTTVATGLMAALRARGLAVSPHKVGPDYIDPSYHALATGRPGRNLDPVLVGAERIAPLFLHGASGADVAVIEGVMGLYDGRGGGREGSTAHVASLLDAPVVLVVDAGAMSGSVAALVHGFRTFEHGLRHVGVILNNVGSPRHEQFLRTALEGVAPVLGVLHRDAAIATPSRHLGLVPAAERTPEALATVRRLGDLVERSCDVPALLALARGATTLAATAWDAAAEVDPLTTAQATASGAGPARPVVAVAAGSAFTFGYAETSELLAAAGAEVVAFDPLRDRLPDGARGLYLGGGFPEVFAAQLAANDGLIADLRHRPVSVYGECAGLLYLCRSLDGHALVGFWGIEATMGPRLTLGYREAESPADTLVTRAGELVVGHEFHRTVTDPSHGPRPAWRWDGELHGFTVGDRVFASYLHVHWAGYPQMASRFVRSVTAPAVAA
ncbi:MAG: cobyrinic acid a,c-diamide synthase [Frankiales bacterium]|nr:cobyrinic acid a,c-diamide synthase [Frankiales bacterium]